MKSLPLDTIALTHEADVGLLTQTVRDVCLESRYDRVDTEHMVLACSEMGHNAVRHGGGGSADIHILKEGKLIRVVISDQGPGIANMSLAKREGYSTVRTSLGLGLESTQRLVDNFDIKSEIGVGTTVVLEKYRPLTVEVVSYGLVSIPDDQYNYNGDQYILKEYDGDSVLIGVVDGPGQGYDAYSIAQSCKQFVENNYRKPLAELMTALNILMKESNDDVGITCSIARITPGEIQYIGLGDTHAYVCVDGHKEMKLNNQDGRVGYVQKVKPVELQEHYQKSAQIIMCSDGLSTLRGKIDYCMPTQELANTLFDDYHKPYGDATIIAAHYTL